MLRKYKQLIMPPMSKRFSELIALISVSTTIFLFLHTQSLTAQIEEIQGVLTMASSAGGSSAAREISQRLLSPEENQVGVDQQQDTVVGGGRNSNYHQTINGQHQHQNQNLYHQYKPKLNATALNNTRLAAKDTLFFNRVPKVGSQTLMDLIGRLSIVNNFNVHRDGTQKVEAIKLTYYEEARLTTMIDMFSPPASYVKHTCFSNFTRHGFPMPIYMNIVRDPIERVISWFYYIRAPWYIVERKQAFPELPLPHPSWLKKDFETCVRSGDRECTFIPGEYHDGVGDHRRQAMFFCGHDERCAEFDGEWAIQQAKRNVEKHYAVVGVLEDLDVSLKVLEGYIPRFFRGASQVYAENQQHMKGINRNIYKPPVSEEVKDILRRNFTKEIDFYHFCRQRLHQQYDAINELYGGQLQLS